MGLSEYTVFKIRDNTDAFRKFMVEEKTHKKISARILQAQRLAELLQSIERIDRLTGDEFDEIKRLAAMVVNYRDPESAKKDFDTYNPNLIDETFRVMLKKLIFPADQQKNLADRFYHFMNVVKTFGPSGTSALLSSRYPEMYGLWTSASFRAMNALRITGISQRKTYKIDGKEYEAYNKKLKEIQVLLCRDVANYTLMDMDMFFEYFTSR